MKKILYILIAAVVFCQVRTDAIEEIEQGQILSLNDCVELAIKNSPEIEIYKQQVEVQDS